MKVLQINSVCGIGSTGRIATDIHNILIEQGHESYIAYGRDLPESCENTIKIGTKFDNYTHVAKTRIFDKHGFGSKKATLDFIDEVKELNPDIIHLHNIHGYYINIEILFNYLNEANKPVIWTLHDCWPFTGHCVYFDYIGCQKWMSTCHDCPQKNTYPASKVVDNSKKNHQMKKKIFSGIPNLNIVTVSNWLKNIVNLSSLGDYPVCVIENGIDLNVFKPTSSEFRIHYNIENKYVLLGVASQWSERKGLGYFIDLSKKLKDNEVIVLVGLTQRQMGILPKNIIGLQKTSNLEELVGIYTAANVFLNLSVEETMGLTTVEALACGTPVIVFNATAVPEVIDDNCGIVVEKENIAMLREALDLIKLKKIEPVVCINRAKLYEKTTKYTQYINLYKKVLK